VIVAIPAVFFILPVIFHRYEDAIAINLGIIAAILLFFGETYYFAIPLILVVATLYKKTKLGLTVTYYAIISLPLQIMQYLDYVLNLSNPQWWEDPAADPFLYVPVQAVFKSMQESMTQFRILEANKVLETITGQIQFSAQYDIVWVTQAILGRYTDSLPGIILFFVIVTGLVSATALLARQLVTKSHTMNAKLILSVVTSASATAVFFFLLIGLQIPLAFRTQVNGLQVLAGISMTSLLTGCATLFDYSPKASLEIEKLSKLTVEKAQELLRMRLQIIEWSLNKVKNSSSLDVGSIEGRMLMIKSKLEDIISNIQADVYNLSELNEKFDEVDKDIRDEIDKLMANLEVSLAQYQILVYSEYSSCVRKLEEIGLDVGATVKTDFQKELSLEMRLELIKEVLEAGRILTIEVIQVAEQSYDIIRSLYDPNLPEKSLAVTFAKKKLDEKAASGIALNALFAALHNWQRQYRTEISKSIGCLQNSLNSIVNLSTKSEELLPILGDDFPKLMDLVKGAEDIRICMEKKTLNVMNILIIREVLQSSLRIVGEVLLIVQEKLVSDEKAIESLLLTKDYSWEKNVEWRKQITSETEMIVNSSKYDLSQVMENLPRSLSYLEELVDSVLAYNEKKEILLNYPIAEMAIDELLKQKKKVYAQDLPFNLKYAEEYLKLFYSQKYLEFSFDRENNYLMKNK
jgi:hypothetical protein